MKVFRVFDSIAKGECKVDYCWRDNVTSVAVLWGIGLTGFIWWLVGVVTL